MKAMFIESKSSKNFADTVNLLTEIIVNGNWKVITIHDLQETMKKNGYEVMPVKVLEVCHPKYASKLLAQNDERIYSNIMPCRISIYKKENGGTYISRLNSGLMASQIGGDILEEVMKNSFNEVERFIAKISIQD